MAADLLVEGLVEGEGGEFLVNDRFLASASTTVSTSVSHVAADTPPDFDWKGWMLSTQRMFAAAAPATAAAGEAAAAVASRVTALSMKQAELDEQKRR